jgi:cell division protein ZipA
MTELRWILLAAGLALIAGLYLWGIRGRLRSAATDPGRNIVAQPPDQPATQQDFEEPERREPQVRLDDAVPEGYDVVPLVEVDETGAYSGRREPTLGQRPAATQARSAAAEPLPQSSDVENASDDIESQTAVEARAQRIVALRVVAPLPSRFEGSLLHEAVLAERFEFGRYEIFHRLDTSGRPVLSLASLREPGTFDPATMAGAAYAGVAIFAVLPGPLTAQQSFEELLGAARALAGRLGGHMQDERGVPLTAQRVVRLREEMLAFDRGRADPARR